LILVTEINELNQYIGHNKNYTKVIINSNEDIIGKFALVRINKTTKWHLESEVLEIINLENKNRIIELKNK